MVTVEIRGKEFPLCLTVAGLEAANKEFGGLKNLTAFLDGKYDPSQMMVPANPEPNTAVALANRAWMLGLLITEGEENRLVCARFDGGDKTRRAVPDAEALSHLLTPGTVNQYLTAIYNAVSESLHQEIEADHSKNADHAEPA